MGVYLAGIVGESRCQAAIREARVGEIVTLRPEPTNKADARAIEVIGKSGKRLGYIERDSWITRCILDEDRDCAARIRSIKSGGGNTRNLGVVIDIAIGNDAEKARQEWKPRGLLSWLLGG